MFQPKYFIRFTFGYPLNGKIILIVFFHPHDDRIHSVSVSTSVE